MTTGTTRLLQDIAAGRVNAANARSAMEQAGGESLVLVEVFRALAQAGGESGGGAIRTPRVAYVETHGDDTTGEVGNPAKPFATGQGAFAAAGGNDVSGPYFVIHFGAGDFEFVIHNWSDRCCGIKGMGGAPFDSASATVVRMMSTFWKAGQRAVVNTYGNGGPNITTHFEVRDLRLYVFFAGQDTSQTDEQPYEGGYGGHFMAKCYGVHLASIQCQGGGSDMGNAGWPGNLEIRGAGWYLEEAICDQAQLEGGELRHGTNAALLTYAQLTLARCSRVNGYHTPDFDLGGNAVY